MSPTLNVFDNAGDARAVVLAFENHPADSRVKLMDNVCQTLPSRMGTGGGNEPFVEVIWKDEQR